MRIVPIAGGKGGVGKSLLAANLAISLSRSGHRVVLADLDLGGSNLHLILGHTGRRAAIGTYLANSDIDFASLLQETDYRNLTFLAGDAEIPGLANISVTERRRLTRNLQKLDADVLIMDLGAGTAHAILDFFLMSSQGVVVSSPTPTATVNAYLFIKNAVFRIMHQSVPRKSVAGRYLDDLFRGDRARPSPYIRVILDEIESVDPEHARQIRDNLRRFRPQLIFNMIEDPTDAEKVQRLRRSCQQYLSTELLHLGIVYRDELQDTALNARLPILAYKPNSLLSQAINRVADKLVHVNEDGDQPLDLEEVDDSFDVAEAEAESDFTTKVQYVEDLLHTGALSTGDLVETVKNQHFEITQLRRQNQLYKAKIRKAIEQGFDG